MDPTCKIICISMIRTPEMGGKNTLEFLNIDCSSNEIIHKKTVLAKHLGWIGESIKTNKTPEGKTLKICEWHSGCNTETSLTEKPSSRCYKKGAPSYSIYFDDYICYDTCSYDTNKEQELEMEKRMKKNQLFNSIDSWFGETIELYEKFNAKIKNIELLKESREKIQKGLSKNKKDFTKNPQYNSLFQLKERAQTNLTFVKNNIKTRWETIKSNKTYEQFEAESSADAVQELKKATDNFNTYVNKETSKNTTYVKMEGELKHVESEIASLELVAKTDIEIPLFLAIKCQNNLNEMLNGKQNQSAMVRKYYRDCDHRILSCYNKMREVMKLYEKFIPKSQHNELYQKVLKNQEEEYKKKKDESAVHGEYIIELDGSITLVEAKINPEELKSMVTLVSTDTTTSTSSTSDEEDDTDSTFDEDGDDYEYRSGKDRGTRGQRAKAY